MQIFIHNGGKQLGPFPESQVSEMLRTGQVTGTDLAWSEGMETWKPLSLFAQFQAGGPPPIPGQPPVPPVVSVPPSQRKTEPLSIWSLVLGILSIVVCSLLTGIPAVICGHIGLGRIKRDPSLDGKGMALAGLITGYFGLLVPVIAIFAALAIPAFVGAKEKGTASQMLSGMKQLHLAMQQAQLDGKTTGDDKLGFPADLKFTSAAQVKKS